MSIPATAVHADGVILDYSLAYAAAQLWEFQPPIGQLTAGKSSGWKMTSDWRNFAAPSMISFGAIFRRSLVLSKPALLFLPQATSWYEWRHCQRYTEPPERETSAHTAFPACPRRFPARRIGVYRTLAARNRLERARL